jgi:heme-degrading monooxygenase HmoA
MIAVLTHHWAKQEMLDEAKKVLERNGAAQQKAPGFGVRQTLYSQEDPTKITTLVTWGNNEDYQAWRASPERAVALAGSEVLWARPNEGEWFDVAG